MFNTLATGKLVLLAILACLIALAQVPQPAIEQIQSLIDRGDYRPALNAANRLIAQSPRHSEAYRLRANARRNLNDLAGALEDANKAVELDPSNARALGGRVIIKKLLKDLPGARADIDRALAVQPGYHQGYDSRALLRQEAGDLAGALSDANRAIELSPQTPAYLIRRAIVRRGLKDLAGADQDLAKTLELAPTDPSAYFQRGLLRLEQKRWNESIADNTRAIDLKLPNAEGAYNNRGLAYKNSGMLAEARRDFDQALKIRPEDASAASNLARLGKAPAAAPPAPKPAAAPAAAPVAARPPAQAASTATRQPPAIPVVPLPKVAPPAGKQAGQSGSATPRGGLEFLHRGNFFRIVCNGSVRIISEGGTPGNVRNFLGGYARYGFPVQWNGDEFFYSGPSFEFDQKGHPAGWMGGNIDLPAGSHLALGKVSPDGKQLLSLRFITHGDNGQEFAIELRDIDLRNQQEKFDATTLFLSNYSQNPAYSKAAELFKSTIRILDLNRLMPYYSPKRIKLLEYRPFMVSVSLFKDPDVPASYGSKEALPAVRKGLDNYWSSSASWAKVFALSEEELAAIAPKRSKAPR